VTTPAPLLLDTCAAIWISGEHPMSRESADAIERSRDAGETIYVSPITAWELGLLVSRGRMNLQMTPERWFARLMEAPGLQLSALPVSVLIASSFLPGTDLRDPADRIIAATAREYGYKIMTRDRPLLDYAEHGHIQAIAC
jgi:PIN domain nuclease of toxin-antitoxin system